MNAPNFNHAMTTSITFSFSFYEIRFLAAWIVEVHMNMMNFNYIRGIIHFVDGDEVM